MRDLLPVQTVKDLIDEGLIIAPSTARGCYQGVKFEAELDSRGEFTWRGQRFSSPSSVAAHAYTAATRRRTPGRAYYSVNGWLIWSVQTPSGEYRPLADVRAESRERVKMTS